MHDAARQGRVPGRGPADAGSAEGGSQGYLGPVVPHGDALLPDQTVREQESSWLGDVRAAVMPQDNATDAWPG